MTTADTNKVSPPPFIAEPPVYNRIVDTQLHLDDTWFDWFNSVSRVMGLSVVTDFFIDPTNKTRTQTAVFQVIAMTTAQRNQLENARQGTIIFNTDYPGTPGPAGPQFQFQTADTSTGNPPTWVTFTPVAVS